MKDMQNVNVLEQVFELESLLHKYYGRLRGAYGSHPRRGQARVLSILKLQPEISQKELSFLLDMRKQSLGELLAKLEAKGLIQREPAPGDHRAMVVRLTEKGAQAAEEIDLEAGRGPDLVEKVLDGQEQAQLVGYLARLAEALRAELAELPDPGADGISHGHGAGYFHRGMGGRPDPEGWTAGPGGPRHGEGRHGHHHKHHHGRGGVGLWPDEQDTAVPPKGDTLEPGGEKA